MKLLSPLTSGIFILSFVSFVAGVVSCNSSGAGHIYTKPLSAQDALSSFELEPGFKIELVAAEPLVADPVDMEIDEFGRMYVVEMHGYPLDKSGSGNIKLITDTDKDGVFDKSIDFATGLVLPNGIMRWKKGIIVSDAPHIIYFEDTDGDGKSDYRDTLLTGFSLSNPHVNVNNPVYGLDNFIHLSHRGAITTRKYEDVFSDKGDTIRFPDVAGSPTLGKNANNHSVRFRPDSHELEMTSGYGQFGHTFDQWGRHFFGDNQNHAFAEIIAAPYISRNPELTSGEAISPISDHGAAADVYQITTHPERQMFSGVGVMTSASGITANLGGLFPAPYDEQVNFICESVSNLVHADHIRDSGATFVASRMGTPRKEFLASTDAWFRPVNLYVGPDGALYIVDYYRQIIEHPEWMSDEAVAAGGLYEGKEKGRIYRVVPENAGAAEWIKGLSMGDESSEKLVQYLAHKNIWWRTHAQRMLVDRKDTSVNAALISMSTGVSPMGRLHALYSMKGLGLLKAEHVMRALQDSVAGIRENAVKLSEDFIDNKKLSAILVKMKDDADAKVRFQLLCTLGYDDSPAASHARQELLFNDISDKWVQIAALSARSSQASALLDRVLQRYQESVPAYGLLVQRLSHMTGAVADQKKITSMISRATDTKTLHHWQASMLSGLADGLRNRKSGILSDFSDKQITSAFFLHPSIDVKRSALKMMKIPGMIGPGKKNDVVARASELATDTSVTNDQRVLAIELLGLSNPQQHRKLLEGFIVPQEHPSIQMAALRTLGSIDGTETSEFILHQWASLTPGVRDAAIGTFMSSDERMNLLLDAVENEKVIPSALGWGWSSRMMGVDNDTIRNRARKLLVNDDQEKINREFQKSLELTGDMDKGKLVFKQNCGLCHQVQGELGIKFGPDLGTVQNWLPKDIMANILNPGQSIAVGFDLWEVKLSGGESVQGIIASETSSAIVLRTHPGTERTINRQEIESLQVIQTSAMPVLSEQISHEQMADLLAFLRRQPINKN